MRRGDQQPPAAPCAGGQKERVFPLPPRLFCTRSHFYLWLKLKIKKRAAAERAALNFFPVFFPPGGQTVLGGGKQRGLSSAGSRAASPWLLGQEESFAIVEAFISVDVSSNSSPVFLNS